MSHGWTELYSSRDSNERERDVIGQSVTECPKFPSLSTRVSSLSFYKLNRSSNFNPNLNSASGCQACLPKNQARKTAVECTWWPSDTWHMLLLLWLEEGTKNRAAAAAGISGAIRGWTDAARALLGESPSVRRECSGERATAVRGARRRCAALLAHHFVSVQCNGERPD